MDQRQLEKERIRLTREIAMFESQLEAAMRGKEEKMEENRQIREEIAQLEEENKELEEEIRHLDEEIAKLDEEFKQAQIDAGRLRREIKLNNERAEAERKKAAQLRTEVAKLEKQLEVIKREVRQEIEDRRALESKLRKTNAQIDAMKSHRLAAIVTRKLEKQEWYKRMEDSIPVSTGEENIETEQVQAEPIQAVTNPPETEREEEKKPAADQGGIDFS